MCLCRGSLARGFRNSKTARSRGKSDLCKITSFWNRQIELEEERHNKETEKEENEESVRGTNEDKMSGRKTVGW